MSRFMNSWAILPATMELWNKRKITIPECASVWDDGTVLVCCVDNSNGTKFIHGAQGDYGVKVGDRHRCHHDQTGVDKGWYTILNIVNWKKVGDQIVIESALPFDHNTKGSLAVLK